MCEHHGGWADDHCSSRPSIRMVRSVVRACLIASRPARLAVLAGGSGLRQPDVIAHGLGGDPRADCADGAGQLATLRLLHQPEGSRI